MHFALLYICAATSKKFVTFLISTGAKKARGLVGSQFYFLLFFGLIWISLQLRPLTLQVQCTEVFRQIF